MQIKKKDIRETIEVLQRAAGYVHNSTNNFCEGDRAPCKDMITCFCCYEIKRLRTLLDGKERI